MCDLGLPCGDPYCPFVSDYVQKAIEKEEKSSYNPGPDTSPDFNRFDPWQGRERTPTHMDF
jgi:hypothetical protein